MTFVPTASELRRTYAEEPFSVFAVTRSCLQPAQSQTSPGLHPTFFFALHGQAMVEAAGIELPAVPGTIAHGAGSTLQLTAQGDEPFECVAISYVAGRHSVAGKPCAFDSAWTFGAPNYQELAERADRLEQLGESPDLESRLNQIIGATSFIKGIFDEAGVQDAPEGLRRAKAYMDAHYAQQLTLDELGSIAGLSPKRFSERFIQAFGTRPLAYLIGTRVERATELLATDMLIKDIARTVGYEDQFYFSRIYKKYTGRSPEAARKELHP